MLGIHAVALLTGRSPDALRAAERAGIIPQALRTPGGQRRWSLSDVEAIRRALLRTVAEANAAARIPVSIEREANHREDVAAAVSVK